MDIIPPVVLELARIYSEPLNYWFSQHLYAALIPGLKKDEFLVSMQEMFDFAPLEQACASYHHQAGPGAKPEHTTPVLVRALLLRYLFGWSLKNTERQLRVNLLLKWFVGLGVLAPVLDHATLFRFEKWVRENKLRTFFDESLRQIDLAYPNESLQVQIGDTFAMQANAARESLNRKLGHTCRKLLRVMEKEYPDGYRLFQAALGEHDQAQKMLYPPKGRAPERYLNKEAYQQRVQERILGVLDFQKIVRSLLPGCPGETLVRIGQFLTDLERIIKDEVKIEYDAAGEIVRISELPSDKKGSPLLGSATDRQATYRVHDGGNDVQLGYNIGVLASKDGLIREIEAFTGATADQEIFPALVSAEKEHGVCPDELVVDRAGGSGKSRARIALASDGKTQVIAYTMPYDKRSDRFVPTDFTLAEDGQVLTCPNGKSTANAYAHGSADGRQFRFCAELCQGCPFNPHANPDCLDPEKQLDAPLPPSGHRLCRDPETKLDSFRNVFVSNYREILAEAEAYNQTDAFKEKMKLRPRIERVIAEMTRYNGARRAHSQGTMHADFQTKMCATAYNLKLWVRRVQAADKAAAARVGARPADS
jgi:hypothetical protein